jgi:hypothetical protein
MSTATKKMKPGKAVKETREEALERLLRIALEQFEPDFDETRMSLRELEAAGLSTGDKADAGMPFCEAFNGECLYWLECAKPGARAAVGTVPADRLGAGLMPKRRAKK